MLLRDADSTVLARRFSHFNQTSTLISTVASSTAFLKSDRTASVNLRYSCSSSSSKDSLICCTPAAAHCSAQTPNPVCNFASNIIAEVNIHHGHRIFKGFLPNSSSLSNVFSFFSTADKIFLSRRLSILPSNSIPNFSVLLSASLSRSS
jgi:hypothetical protein